MQQTPSFVLQLIARLHVAADDDQRGDQGEDGQHGTEQDDLRWVQSRESLPLNGVHAVGRRDSESALERISVERSSQSSVRSRFRGLLLQEALFRPTEEHEEHEQGAQNDYAMTVRDEIAARRIAVDQSFSANPDEEQTFVARVVQDEHGHGRQHGQADAAEGDQDQITFGATLTHDLLFTSKNQFSSFFWFSIRVI